MTAIEVAIEVEGLVKSYGDQVAVDGLDLEVRTGEILAFLGPNGAGKTTTVEILEGYLDRTAGRVSVLGVDPARAPRSWRERLGIVLQECQPIAELTPAEAVELQRHYYRQARPAEEVLRLVGLWDARNQRTARLSGGQQRRLDLALALVGGPELIFLDEPTTGFDPSARRESWSMIEALRSSGATVLLTTHYMDEAQHLADRIAVIAEGRLVAEGTAADLAARVTARPRISWTLSPTGARPPDGPGLHIDGNRARIETDEIVPALHRLTGWAVDQGEDLADLAVVQPTLEDVYLALTGSGT